MFFNARAIDFAREYKIKDGSQLDKMNTRRKREQRFGRHLTSWLELRMSRSLKPVVFANPVFMNSNNFQHIRSYELEE